jgi:hypothetical protein
MNGSVRSGLPPVNASWLNLLAPKMYSENFGKCPRRSGQDRDRRDIASALPMKLFLVCGIVAVPQYSFLHDPARITKDQRIHAHRGIDHGPGANH